MTWIFPLIWILISLECFYTEYFHSQHLEPFQGSGFWLRLTRAGSQNLPWTMAKAHFAQCNMKLYPTRHPPEPHGGGNPPTQHLAAACNASPTHITAVTSTAFPVVLALIVGLGACLTKWTSPAHSYPLSSLSAPLGPSS